MPVRKLSSMCVCRLLSSSSDNSRSCRFLSKNPASRISHARSRLMRAMLGLCQLGTLPFPSWPLRLFVKPNLCCPSGAANPLGDPPTFRLISNRNACLDRSSERRYPEAPRCSGPGACGIRAGSSADTKRVGRACAQAAADLRKLIYYLPIRRPRDAASGERRNKARVALSPRPQRRPGCYRRRSNPRHSLRDRRERQN